MTLLPWFGGAGHVALCTPRSDAEVPGTWIRITLRTLALDGISSCEEFSSCRGYTLYIIYVASRLCG